MARHRMGGKSYRKSFAKKQRRTRAINQPAFVMRGGTRL